MREGTYRKNTTTGARNMKSIALSALLFAPSVLAECAGFRTTDYWTTQLDGWDGYEFLQPPVLQVSDYITCNASSMDHGGCGDEFCILRTASSLKWFPKYNVSFETRGPRRETLEEFFEVVSKAVEANKGLLNITVEVTPMFETCLGVDDGVCVPDGESRWINVAPLYHCVSGTAEGCVGGPFESGTQMKVCAVDRDREHPILRTNENRTITYNNMTYLANETNPNAAEGSNCPVSFAALGIKIEILTLGLLTFTAMIGLAL